MTRLVLVLCLVLGAGGSRPARQIRFPNEDDCQTPERQPGQCLPLPQCAPLADIRDLRLLRRSICGFQNDLPRVCCPRSGDVPPSSTLRPSPSGPRTAGSAVLPSDCGLSDKPLTRIVGGTKSQLAAWPWLAAVYLTRSGLSRGTDCGGTLISRRHVVTAAHCVVDDRGNRMSASTLTVRLGEHKLNDDNDGAHPRDFRVSEIRSHPQFVRRTYKNDIAVLVLDGTVEFDDFIRPICLPFDWTGETNLTDRRAFVAGWGTTAFDGNFNPELTEIQIPIWDQAECARVFQREVAITREYVCAGVNDGSKDSCQGDSGGPLMLPSLQPDSQVSRFYLVGVVSFGKRCGTPNFPGVYTRVDRYLDWIADNLP